MATEGLFLVAAILIGGAALAKLAEEHRLPYPLPLILAGIILGGVFPAGDLFSMVGVDFLGQLTLAAVLFYAGLTMNVRELRMSISSVLLLATLGVVLTSLIAGTAIFLFSTIGVTAFLIGAVLSPTDPAALFSVLESGGVRVKRKLFSILEGEAVFNDATAVILVITVFEPMVVPQLSRPWPMVFIEFFASVALGVLIGLGVAYALGMTLLKTGTDTNVAILTATTPILAYGVGEVFAVLGLHPGALAAVFAGIFMANSKTVGLDVLPQRSMRGVMRNVSFAFEIAIFVLLGYTLDTQFLLSNSSVVVLGLVIAALVILVARPASVFIVTAADRTMSFKDRFFLSWAGVKGVASAALAAISVSIITEYEVTGHVLMGQTINAIVFIVLVVSLVVQGLSTPFLAKKLGLVEREDVAREVTAHRDATRQALLHLVDLYTEGKVEPSLYTRLKAELEEEIFRLEDELRRIVAEKRARIEELSVRETLLRKRLEFYQQEYERGRISESMYEERRSELEAEIEEIQNRIRMCESGQLM